MGRWIVIVIALASCASPGMIGSDTVASERTTTSTSSPGSVATPIEGRGLSWEPGTRYTSEAFVVQPTFEVGRIGWTSQGADAEWITLILDEDGDGVADVSLGFFAHSPEALPEQLIDQILSTDGIEPTGPTTSTAVGTVPALSVDIDAAPHDSPDYQFDETCSRPAGSVRFEGDFPGYPLIDGVLVAGVPWSFGIPACSLARVWAASIGGVTIAIISVPRDNGRFEELAPIVEAFLENNVTFGDTDG